MGQCTDRVPETVIDLQFLRILCNPLRTRLFIDAIDIRHKTQILDSAQPIIKIRIVRKIGKYPLRTERILRNIDAVNGNLSLFKLQNSRRTPQRRRLAGAVLTNKADNLPIRDIDGNAMQNFFLPKAQTADIWGDIGGTQWNRSDRKLVPQERLFGTE